MYMKKKLRPLYFNSNTMREKSYQISRFSDVSDYVIAK